LFFFCFVIFFFVFLFFVLQVYWIILTQNHYSSVICLSFIWECR